MIANKMMKFLCHYLPLKTNEVPSNIMFMLRLISKSMDKSHDHTRVFIDNFFNAIGEIL